MRNLGCPVFVRLSLVLELCYFCRGRFTLKYFSGLISAGLNPVPWSKQLVSKSHALLPMMWLVAMSCARPLLTDEARARKGNNSSFPFALLLSLRFASLPCVGRSLSRQVGPPLFRCDCACDRPSVTTPEDFKTKSQDVAFCDVAFKHCATSSERIASKWC